MMQCSKGLAYLGLPHNAFQSRDDFAELCAGIISKPLQVGPVGDDRGPAVDQSGVPPKLEVRSSSGRGSGLFAIDRIPAYSRLLADDALLSLAQGEDLPQLWEKYSALPVALRDEFDGLSFPPEMVAKERSMVAKLETRGYSPDDSRNMARVNSKWQANAFKTGGANIGSPASHKWSYSLFGKVARINHSCTPNACAHYRPSGVEMVYALRDIHPGEEVEIAYFDMTMAFADRQERAQAWGFLCSCDACSRCETSVSNSYEQRLSHVHKNLTTGQTSRNVEEAIDSMQTAIAIAHSPDYPWLSIALPKLYLALFNLEAAGHARDVKLKEILTKVLEWEEKITGTDSPTSIARRKTWYGFDLRP